MHGKQKKKTEIANHIKLKHGNIESKQEKVLVQYCTVLPGGERKDIYWILCSYIVNMDEQTWKVSEKVQYCSMKI